MTNLEMLEITAAKVHPLIPKMWSANILDAIAEITKLRKENAELHQLRTEFNTEWQHDPPQDDDTKWVKVQWCKWLNDAS